MGITSKDLLTLLYDRKLPQVYRDEDKSLGLPLKRYLESLIDGGYRGTIEDIESMAYLVDPEKIPDKFLPYLCESFGLTYFPDIDTSYQRKFLMNIGEVIKRRGTFSSIHYMIRVLTGLESELSVEITEDDQGRSRYALNVVLLANSVAQLSEIELSMKVVADYIQANVPYYITVVLSHRIYTQVIQSTAYAHSGIGTYKQYRIGYQEI